MIETVEPKHHVPGRMRLRFPSAKGNRESLERIRSGLRSLAGVRSVDANPTTGALVIYYDPAQYGDFPQRLSEFAARENLFELKPADVPQSGADRSLTDQTLEYFGDRMNRSVQGATGNAISLRELFPFGVAAWAAIFVDPAMVAAQWLNWIQFAWSAYFDLHQEDSVHDVHREVDALRNDLAAIRELLEQRLPPKPGSPGAV